MSALARLDYSAAAEKITPSIEQSRDEIHAMLDVETSGGLLWANLASKDKKAFCLIAGVHLTDFSRPLHKVNQFDRRRLFIAIKHVEQLTTQFASISLAEFN